MACAHDRGQKKTCSMFALSTSEKITWGFILFLGGTALSIQIILSFKKSDETLSKDQHVLIFNEHRSNVKEIDTRRISDLLVDAIIQVESAGNPLRVGNVGERGLMQIRKATWNQMSKKLYGNVLSFDKAFDPEINKRVGKRYLVELQSLSFTL